VIAELLGVAARGARIDVNHNHVALRDHGGRRLLVHRTGAIRAYRDVLAVIPGSMGTAMYIVEGLGNPASFVSASHGAGRVLSRGEAHRKLRRERVTRSLRHVEHRVAGAIVKEAPAAYREIADVLNEERDLVTPMLRLEPIVVLTG
jgi:tRNA-splicing ligase RtcB